MSKRWPTFLVVILAAIQLSFPALANRNCPMYCVCSNHEMSCDGKRFPLHTIPKAPSYITQVEIININLGQLNRSMMTNLTHCNMTSLSLTATNITIITDDAFQDLKYLQTFEWEQSHISISEVSHCVLSFQSELKVLIIKADNTDDHSMNATIFQQLTKLNILTISLRRLELFDATALSLLTDLDELNLPNNRLEELVINSVLLNVTQLDLSGNCFERIPQMCKSNSTPVMPRLENLNIGTNLIKYLNVTPLTCLPNLLNLTLSENSIEEIPDNAFSSLSQLTSLHMARLRLKKINELAFNSSSLYRLIFFENPTLSVKRFNPSTLFKNTPNLGILMMANTKMKIKPYRLKRFLLNLRNIEILVMQRTKVKELPSGVFSKLTKLKKLILSGNYFSHWKSDVFENVTSIEMISFGGCNINTIKEDSFPLEFRLSVKEIDLSDNPFTCTCEMLWFRNWMKAAIANKSIKFSNYPKFYDCRAPNVKGMPLATFNPTAQSCTVSETYSVILTIVFCFIIVCIVVGLVAYRYRWYLLYWISLFRRRRQRQQRQQLREMKYDAFVSYSNNDSDWIYDELLHYLEGELELRLCEHSRDFEGGKLIVDNVFDALDTSGKTILVISNDYMQSDWCQFELQMALNSFYKHEVNLIVVLLEPIQARHVTSTLRALMTSTTYIEWSEDIEAQALFRQRLKTSMKN